MMRTNTYNINGKKLDLVVVTSIDRGTDEGERDLATFDVFVRDAQALIELDVRGNKHTWTDEFDGFLLGRYTMALNPHVVIEIRSASGAPLGLSNFAVKSLPEGSAAALDWEGEGTACLRTRVQGDAELELELELGGVDVTAEQTSEGPKKKKILIVTKPDFETGEPEVDA